MRWLVFRNFLSEVMLFTLVTIDDQAKVAPSQPRIGEMKLDETLWLSLLLVSYCHLFTRCFRWICMLPLLRRMHAFIGIFE